jgi:hypothetical protein
LLVFVVPAIAADYPPTSGSLTVDSNTAAPGGTITAAGVGCAAEARVAFAVASAGAGSTTADTAGAFSGTLTIPSSVSGVVEVTSTCPTPSGTMQVLGATITITTAGLPRTGADTFPAVGFGLVVLCVGSASVVAARRRGVTRVSR